MRRRASNKKLFWLQRGLFVLICALLHGEAPRAAASEPPPFRKSEIQFGKIKVKVELAIESHEQTRGLMFRKALCENCGMLFVYQDEQIRSFWMKNTFIPLSIGFFNKEKELIEVQEMSPVLTEIQAKIPTYESKGPAMYALEMNSGWFKKNKILNKAKFRYAGEARPSASSPPRSGQKL